MRLIDKTCTRLMTKRWQGLKEPFKTVQDRRFAGKRSSLKALALFASVFLPLSLSAQPLSSLETLLSNGTTDRTSFVDLPVLSLAQATDLEIPSSISQLNFDDFEKAKPTVIPRSQQSLSVTVDASLIPWNELHLERLPKMMAQTLQSLLESKYALTIDCEEIATHPDASVHNAFETVAMPMASSHFSKKMEKVPFRPSLQLKPKHRAFLKNDLGIEEKTIHASQESVKHHLAKTDLPTLHFDKRALTTPSQFSLQMDLQTLDYFRTDRTLQPNFQPQFNQHLAKVRSPLTLAPLTPPSHHAYFSPPTKQSHSLTQAHPTRCELALQTAPLEIQASTLYLGKDQICTSQFTHEASAPIKPVFSPEKSTQTLKSPRVVAGEIPSMKPKDYQRSPYISSHELIETRSSTDLLGCLGNPLPYHGNCYNAPEDALYASELPQGIHLAFRQKASLDPSLVHCAVDSFAYSEKSLSPHLPRRQYSAPLELAHHSLPIITSYFPIKLPKTTIELNYPHHLCDVTLGPYYNSQLLAEAQDVNHQYRQIGYPFATNTSFDDIETKTFYNAFEVSLRKNAHAFKERGSYTIDLRSHSSLKPLKQNFHILIDRACLLDSMKLDAIQKSVKRAMHYVTSNATFNIYLFDSSLDAMKSSERVVDPSFKTEVRTYLSKLQPSFQLGSVKFHRILSKLSTRLTNPSEIHTVLLISDGHSLQFDPKSKLLNALPEHGFVLYALGVGYKQNKEVLKEIAHNFGGIYHSARTYGRLSQKLATLIQNYSRPMATDLYFAVLDRNLEEVHLNKSRSHSILYMDKTLRVKAEDTSLRSYNLMVQGKRGSDWVHFIQNINSHQMDE